MSPTPHIPDGVRASLEENHLRPALWYVGPLQDGGKPHSKGPGRPIKPRPPAPASAPVAPQTTVGAA